uniref:Uncharacterized protein n=1 Tax=Anguilla anguilla TaxID=7936 RepID=A0A0E9RBL0_ANGAN
MKSKNYICFSLVIYVIMFLCVCKAEIRQWLKGKHSIFLIVFVLHTDVLQRKVFNKMVSSFEQATTATSSQPTAGEVNWHIFGVVKIRFIFSLLRLIFFNTCASVPLP